MDAPSTTVDCGCFSYLPMTASLPALVITAKWPFKL